MGKHIVINEPLSILDIFKVGIGPSSSHTLGPWRAAELFSTLLLKENLLAHVVGIQTLLYGSLAKTGKGHGTDIAIMLGLVGYDPITVDTDRITSIIASIEFTNKLFVKGIHEIRFEKEHDFFFISDSLPYHPNGMVFQALLKNNRVFTSTYYSTGGGFIEQESSGLTNDTTMITVKYPVATAADLLAWCNKTGLPISSIVRENEKTWRPPFQTNRAVLQIYEVMKNCIYTGCHTPGILPGGLQVSRRAPELYKKLHYDGCYYCSNEWIVALKKAKNDFQNTLDWVTCFALAVNEENAAFSRVVAAPTNGAAGVIPSVLFYYILFCDADSEKQITDFLLTASEIGNIFKKGATISAAMGGCQAEIGVSSAMAAAALTEGMGGTPRQVLMAAEIAMEHHLGLTCDPVGGLVQIPCIERNAMGAIKAITASQLALKSNPLLAKVSLDSVITAMWNTAMDMSSKYKETSEVGLALNIPLALSEC